MYDGTTFSPGGITLTGQMLRRTAVLPLALLLLGSLALTGCSQKTEEEYLSEANAMMQESNLLKATILYKEFLEKFPESEFRLGAQMGLAEAYYRNKEYELCRDVLDQVIEQNGGASSPAGFQPFLTKLRTYNEEGKFEEGLQVAEATSDSLSTAPRPMKQAFQMFLGDLYARNQKLGEALAVYQVILQTPPPTVDDEVFHLQLLTRSASIYESRGQLDQGLQMFQDYVERNPKVGTAGQLYQSMARIQKHLGDTEGAEESFDAAEASFRELLENSESEENKVKFRIGIANLKYNRGQTPEADEILRDIIDNHPNSSSRAIALNMLAGSRIRAQDFETAMGLLQEIVTNYPNTNEANQAIQQAQLIRAIRQADATSTTGTETVSESMPLAGESGTDAAPPETPSDDSDGEDAASDASPIEEATPETASDTEEAEAGADDGAENGES